jgi:hypothetical protein
MPTRDPKPGLEKRLPSVAEEAGPSVSDGGAPAHVLEAILATGGATLDAFVHLYRCGDPVCRAFAVPGAADYLRTFLGQTMMVARDGDILWDNARLWCALERPLCDLLVLDPELGNVAFRSMTDLRIEDSLNLAGCGWPEGPPEALTGLPDGLGVSGLLCLDGNRNLTETPRGLWVGEELRLACCDNLRSLQGGLVVGGDLTVTGCPSWDGILPPDAAIGGKIVTDQHVEGLSLPQWRQRYGDGSCHGTEGLAR